MGPAATYGTIKSPRDGVPVQAREAVVDDRVRLAHDPLDEATTGTTCGPPRCSSRSAGTSSVPDVTYRRPMAAIFVMDDDTPWQVVETGREVLQAITDAEVSGARFVEVHLANQDEWNGKALFLRVASIHSVSPPKRWLDDDE